MKFLVRYASAVTVLSVLVLLATRQLLSRTPYVIAVQVAAVALAVWARTAFPRGQFSVHPEPRAPRLIESGPYRWIRHPMYAAALLLVWSGALGHPALLPVAIGVVETLVVGVRIAGEERFLRDAVPGYAAFAARTKRVVPFVY